MSDYDEYFDSIDDDILEDLNVLESNYDAKGFTSKPSTSKQPAKSASNRPVTPHTDTDYTFDEISVDTEELKQLEDAALKQAQAAPSRRIEPVANMSNSRQINLHGDVLPPQSPQRQVQHRPAFGQKLQKTKTWDQTAFAKTGWKSTKPPKAKRTKSKSTGDGIEEEEDYVDLEGLAKPFMPCEFHHHMWITN